MAKRSDSIKASFPPLHKKRLYQGVAVYAMVMIALGAFVFIEAENTVSEWNSRIPQAEVPVRAVFSTPQITDASAADITFEDPSDDSAAALPPGGALISLIVEGAGLSKAETIRAIEDLPPAVAISFSPYTYDLGKWIEETKSYKHEALILLPMEPVTYPKDDPGPKSLLTRLSEDENSRNLNEILTAAKNTDGVINYMGSRFLNDEGNLSSVFNRLKKRGGIFIETPATLKTAAETVAGRVDLPYLQADMRIDEKATDAGIKQQLIELEKIARQRGYAIGLVQPLPLSFNVVKTWAETAQQRGITLAPLSDTLKAKKQSPSATSSVLEQE